MTKKLSTTKKVLISLLSLLVLIIIGVVSYTYYLSSKVNRAEVDRSAVVDTGKNIPEPPKDVITVALFGTDYMGKDIGAADSTMILSIDKKNNQIKLCSLMRDMYLDLPEGGQKNLNYTMSDGGYEGILKTINYNFDLKVDKFIQVDLHHLPIVIDKLGGVDLNITSEEVPVLNSYINHIDQKNGTTTRKLTNAGVQTLNGTQAAAYTRIRSTTGRDFKRSNRQRDVLESLFKKMNGISIPEATSIATDLLPLVTTNLSNPEIISITSDAIGTGATDIKQARFPEDDDQHMILTDMYHMITDIPTTTAKIHKFLYEKVE